MQKGRRTAAGTGMVRSSETTENGDVDADALLKKESPIPTCSGDGAACAVRIATLSCWRHRNSPPRGIFVYVKNYHTDIARNEVLQCGISYARGKLW